MIAAIFKFFSEVFQFLLGIVTGTIKWIREHPRATLEILGAILLALWVRHYYVQATTEAVWKDANVIINAQKAQIDKANTETAVRDAKIKRIEVAAKSTADTLTQALAKAHTQTKQIVADYDKKLAVEKAKYKVVTVKEPVTGKDVEVNINPQGEVVCQRFPSTFTESVNQLINKINQPLDLNIGGTQ